VRRRLVFVAGLGGQVGRGGGLGRRPVGPRHHRLGDAALLDPLADALRALLALALAAVDRVGVVVVDRLVVELRRVRFDRGLHLAHLGLGLDHRAGVRFPEAARPLLRGGPHDDAQAHQDARQHREQGAEQQDGVGEEACGHRTPGAYLTSKV
jgi:hypothetical protein